MSRLTEFELIYLERRLEEALAHAHKQTPEGAGSHCWARRIKDAEADIATLIAALRQEWRDKEGRKIA
jgi:hypothetical protein